jgi:hypothetical protein
MRRCAVSAVLVLVACTDATAGGDGPAPAASVSPPAGSASSSPPIAPDDTLFVRTCESSVYGDLGPGWRRREISAGPITFVGARGYADDPERWFSAPADLATSQKVLVVVTGERPVTVSVRHPDAALAYDPERWGQTNTVPFRRGYPRTRFEPCGGDDRRATQFNGGFLLRGPACVPVEVRPEGAAPMFLTLSFGAGECR